MADAPRLKTMKVVEILDASFRLYRDNFVTFLGILAGAYVPVILIELLTRRAMMSSLNPGAPRDPHDSGAVAVYGLVMLLMALLTMVAFSLATGALTRAVSSRYLNEPASIGACYSFIVGILLKYLGTNLLYGLVIGLGLLLCVVPGLIFAIMFAFTSPIVVLEGLGGTSAMGRSRQLARGNWLRIIGMGLLMIIVQLLLQLGLGAALGLVVPKMTTSAGSIDLINQGVTQVFSMILAPFLSVAWILLYYDIRIRSEAFDLEVLAKSMGGVFAPGPGKALPPP